MKPNKKQLEHAAEIFGKFMLAIGLDPSKDEHLQDTPLRVTKMLCESTKNYRKKAKVTTNAVYDAEEEIKITSFSAESGSELILVRDIEISSLCGHHFMPFFGKAHIGYLPNEKLVGLSKLARIADYCAKRPQTQEAMTSDIMHMLVEHTDPLFAGVIIEATHTCMSCRGCRKQGAVTITSKFHNQQMHDTTKKEFLSFLGFK